MLAKFAASTDRPRYPPRMRPVPLPLLATALAACALPAVLACGDVARYPAPAVASSAQVVSVPPSAAADPRVDDLQRRVGSVERQVATQAASSQVATPSTGWSCAAQCITKYKCTNNGEYSVTFKRVEGVGDTALAAFKKLTEACPKDDDLEVDAQCRAGQMHETDATLVNACVKN